jgi:hypothetical protein
MAFHAFHILSFHGLLFFRQGWINRDATQRNASRPPRNAYRYRLSMSNIGDYGLVENGGAKPLRFSGELPFYVAN